MSEEEHPYKNEITAIEMSLALEEWLTTEVGKAFVARAERDQESAMRTLAHSSIDDERANWQYRLDYHKAHGVLQYMADIISEGHSAGTVLDQAEYDED